MEQDRRLICEAEARFVLRLGRAGHLGVCRDDGASGVETWAVERLGLSGASARALARLGERALDLPHLMGSLSLGEISLDKVKAVADVATRRSDRMLRDQALECSVRQLADVARTTAASRAPGGPDGPPPSHSEYEGRYLRLNDERRSVTAQLPKAFYAEFKASLLAQIEPSPPEGKIPLDQRYCDALVKVLRSARRSGGSGGADPYVVVAHTALSTLVEDSGPSSVLAAELEALGLIDTETIKRIACDATIIIGVDDDVGHTLYEGRAQRFATATQRREVSRRDRTCRFPACTNVTFTNVHHVVPWKRGGRTDIDNLALLCEFHHHRVHSTGWSMTGNANEELTIVTPSNRTMTSRPSQIWARVSAS
jgi:hypothetical protein